MVIRSSVVVALSCCMLTSQGAERRDAAPAPPIVLPMGRHCYVIGEEVPLGFRDAEGEAKLEAVDEAGTRLPLYTGKPTPLIFHTQSLAPGNYKLQLNGADTGVELTLASPIRRSAGALTDESLPSRPDKMPEAEWRKQLIQTLRETGINAAFAMCDDEAGRHADVLDAFTATGTMLFINPYTRPMSFNPARVYKREMDAFNQRLALIAQANARYPSFGGFCFDFDPVGFLNRKMLLFYWGWGNQEQALRNYLARSDDAVYEEFTRRTGLKAPRLDEYVLYTLAIGRPDFAPAIDLPTARWLEEMARCLKVGQASSLPAGKMPAPQLADLEKRIDAWSNYLMGLYEESHQSHLKVLREVAPTMRHTSSINLDHCVVKDGQYLPSAYRPLDFRYLTAWSDQVGGPDYAYQWLLSAALLNTYPRRNEPIWIGSALGMVHGQAEYPGKFVRSIAHGLAHGASGAGFALEGFSTVLGGMNKETQWANMKGKAMAEDLRSGKDFLDRFAFLATECRGDYGVGILFSRTQHARQHLAQGFGTPQYKALVTLTRLGYTPRFVTEEEIEAVGVNGVKALVLVGQTFPLPPKVVERIEAFAKKGGRVLLDDASTIKLAGAESLGVAMPYEIGGRPYNWACPNIVGNDNPVRLIEAEYKRIAPAVLRSLGSTGRALLIPVKGADSRVTILEFDGGPDAKYFVAVNDSSIRTHTDWFQVKERLAPRLFLSGDVWPIFDLDEEKATGHFLMAGPHPEVPAQNAKQLAEWEMECDLTGTTARVFAAVQRGVKAIALSATTQSVPAGEWVSLRVGFEDEKGKPLVAALPFHLEILRPDGRPELAAYRSTSREGTFAFSILLPANAPEGDWKAEVRSEITGDLAELPLRISPRPERAKMAAPLVGQVIFRHRGLSAPFLNDQDRKVILPIPESPHSAQILELASQIQAKLQGRMWIEIKRKLEFSTYWLAYDPTPEQLAENARAERGETIGRIKCTTVNRNDYFATLSGYAFGDPIILLDLASERSNEMVGHLDKIGVLWPEVSAAFPGPGKAIAYTVPWAFGPHAPALVVRAWDIEGLKAFADSLGMGAWVGDWLGTRTQVAREALFTDLSVKGETGRLFRSPQPEMRTPGTTSQGLRTHHGPKPFEIRFLDKKPITEDQIVRPAAKAREAVAVPGTIEPKQYVPQLRRGDAYEDAWSPGGDWPKDLRFADAMLLVIDVKQPGKTAIVAEGSFRYSDRKPRSQANWEDILELREKIVPKERRPMEFEVVLDGKPIGHLDKLTTAEREVEVKAPPGFGREGAVKVTEEVVTAIRGEVDLPAGPHRLMLIHRNIVDGKLEKVRVGTGP